MLPALTVRRRNAPSRRVLLSVASALLTLAAASAAWTASAPEPRAPSLADELRPATWAINVPMAWLAAPAPPMRRGEAVDLLAMRSGEKAYVVPVAYGLVVLAVSDRGLLLEVDETDASAIAAARGGGMLLVALLRSTR